MAAVPSLVHAGAKLEAALKLVAAKQVDDAASALFALLAEVEKDCDTYSVDGAPPKELLHFKARVVGNLGNALYRQGPKMMEQALEHFCEARGLFSKVGDGAREGSICYSTANALDRLGMHVEAVDMMQEFLRLGEEHGAPEKRLATARAWIAKRTGSNAATGSSNPFGDDSKPAGGAKASKGTAPKVRLTPMQALEAAAEAADTPLTALLGTGTTMATPMLEFGFENLQFADVLDRSSKSLRNLDSVCGLLRARANAEERYAESLVNARAEEQSGVVGEVTAGLWSAFGSMVGAGSAALGIDDPLDPLSGGSAAGAAAAAAAAASGAVASASSARSLGAAVEAVAEGTVIGEDIDSLGAGASTRQRRTESYGHAQGLGAGAAGARRWDNGTIAAAVTSIERHAVSEAARRRRLAAAWQQGVSQLSGIKAHHASLHKEATSKAEALVRSVTAARRKLLRGHERLRKAHSGEADAKASLHRATEAVSKLVARYGGSPASSTGETAPSTAAGEQGARAVREAKGEAARRAKQLERAVLETGQAEKAVQAAVVEHLTTRRVRDGQLAELARRLQAAEEARLEALAGALRLAGTRWQVVQRASAEAGTRLARAVERVDPGSDIRQFIHQRRVVRRVKEQAVELRRWEANRVEAERRRARREASAKAKAEELEAEAGIEAAAAAAKLASNPEGADADADGDTAELVRPDPGSHETSPDSAAGDVTPSQTTSTSTPAVTGTGAGAGGWLRRFTRRGRAGTGASGDSVGDGVQSPVTGSAPGQGGSSASDGDEEGTVAMEALEGLRDEDDEGACVVPVSVSRERASTFASDSMKSEAELAPVARAWVVRLFAGAAHGVTDAEASLAGATAAGKEAAPASVDDESSALPVSGPSGGDYLAATDEAARAAILRGDDDAIAARLFAQPSGRALFLSELNWWRAHGRRLRSGLARLGKALRLCLDACKDKDDVAAAKLLMIMSQTFYSVRGLDTIEDDTTDPAGEAAAAAAAATAGGSSDEEAGSKRFASDWLHGHALWLDAAFWEEALYRSVREESERPFAPFLRGEESGVFTERLVLTSSRAAKGREKAAEMKQTEDSEEAGADGSATAAATTSPPSPSDAAGSSSAASGDEGERLSAPPFLPGSTEWAYAYRQALFGQLGSYAMNMLAFGMPEEEATRVVSRLARGNGLPAEMLQALLVSMDPSSSLHREAERQERRKHAAKPEQPSTRAESPKEAKKDADAASASDATELDDKVTPGDDDAHTEQVQEGEGEEDDDDDEEEDDAMYDDD